MEGTCLFCCMASVLNDVFSVRLCACVKDMSHSYLSSKQCAADRTQQESMRTPPHLWKCFLCRAW